MDSVNVRNLEQIQEQASSKRSPRLLTLFLCSIAGALLVSALVMTKKRQGPPARSSNDPLAALVAEAKSQPATAEKLEGKDVTFPALLSDEAAPTTALAAVKDERGRLVQQSQTSLPVGTPLAPPPAADRLPVVPLPAGTLLSATPITTQPRDQLTALAASASRVEDSSKLAPAGAEGGYQIQVASFKDQADAEKFVDDLRKRGHKAYRQSAYVPERGLWHRVRIGPFKSKFEADQYKKNFENTERVSPFVIDPHKVKQAEEIRAGKLEVRMRRFGRP